MSAFSISYSAVVPETGFKWVRKKSATHQWELVNEPRDWAEAEQTAVLRQEEVSRPNQIDELYLAASWGDFRAIPRQGEGTNLSNIADPKTYLEFISLPPNAKAFQSFANKHGLLNYPQHGGAFVSLDRSSHHDITDVMLPGPGKDGFRLFMEPASDWLRAHQAIHEAFVAWPKISTRGQYDEMQNFFEDINKYLHVGSPGGFLQPSLALDSGTGTPISRLVPPSLWSLMEVQWISSVANGTDHRQCEQCGSWMAIYSGVGRNDKKYCSDACRMKAYRERKK